MSQDTDRDVQPVRVLGAAPAGPRSPRSLRRRTGARPPILRGPVAKGAAVVLTLLVLVAVLAPLLPLPDPNAQVLQDRLQGPSTAHPFGADDLGRDQLSRLVFGLRISLLAACQATGIALVIGAPLGLASGQLQGWVDQVLTRVFDAVQSIPPLILAMAIVAALGRDLTSAMIAIGVAFSPRLYRVTRGVALSISREEFIEAARSVGGTQLHIVARHTLPNILSPLFVQISVTIAFGMLSESALSFLGLGVQPPDSSLGTMLKTAAGFMRQAPHLMLAPGLLLVVVVGCLTVLTEALRAALATRGQR